MNNPKYICFQPDCYDGNEDEMWWDIQDTIRILIKNDYVIAIHQEDFGLIYVEFADADRSMGDVYPFWLTPEESERLTYEDEG